MPTWLLMFNSFCQQFKIDTLQNAVAGINSYYPLPVYGTTANGSLYGAGLNLRFTDNGKALPAQFARIDFNKKTIIYKDLPGVLSGNGAFWMAAFDRNGKVYISINAPVRKVLRFNLKDSIQFEDLGNPFQDGQSWAYSISLGLDGKMYFGGSGSSTYWSSLNPANSSFEKYGPIDPTDEYVLSIAGDTNFVYAQTGQRNAVRLWSINKADGHKKLLVKVPNTTRIGLETREDGIYAAVNSDTLKGLFKLVKGDTVRVKNLFPTKSIAYEEVNTSNKQAPKISTYFDPVKNELFFSLNNKTFDSIAVSSSLNKVAAKRLFAFAKDTANIYFVGDYYGNYYRYNLKTNTSRLLGSTGYNLYCTLALNDSIMLLGGYPSGFLMKWNRNQPWTTRKFVNGRLVAATDPNANPKIMGFWKSQGKPPAGFHHTAQLLLDAYNNIVGAGNVIRIGNAASIGVYNRAKDSMYGVDYTPYNGMVYSSICRWKKLIIYSMSNQYGKIPKLYFYNSLINKMADSLDLGYEDYGRISVKGDILYGIANDRIYKLDLSRKKIIANTSFPKKTISGAYFLSNGTAIVNANINTVNNSIIRLISLPYHDYMEINGYLYAIGGDYIVRISGLAGK